MSDDDIHLREKLVKTGFSPEEDRIHGESVAYLRRAIGAGQPWKKACDGLRVKDEGLRSLILDDFVKITLAERHFQAEVGLKQIVKSTGIPMDVLIKAKDEMYAEVQAVSVKAYHLTRPAGEKLQ